jgi:chlorite dismutase
MASDLLRTRLGGYIHTPYSYLGMTRHSEYLIGSHETETSLHGVVKPGGCRFLFLYPLVRTRNWYQLPFEDRQRMVREIVSIGRDFPRTRIHVTYSFGLDDQDFLIAAETDYPEDFVERMMRVRELEAAPYVQSDTPVFTCVQTSTEDMLEKIG